MSSREKSVLLGGVISVAVGIAVYLSLQLVFALLVVEGMVGERGIGILQIIGGVIAGGCAGLGTIKMAGWNGGAVVLPVCMVLSVMLLGALIYGDLVVDGLAVARMIAIPAGGIVVKLLTGKRVGRRKRMARARKV